MIESPKIRAKKDSVRPFDKRESMKNGKEQTSTTEIEFGMDNTQRTNNVAFSRKLYEEDEAPSGAPQSPISPNKEHEMTRIQLTQSPNISPRKH